MLLAHSARLRVVFTHLGFVVLHWEEFDIHTHMYTHIPMVHCCSGVSHRFDTFKNFGGGDSTNKITGVYHNAFNNFVQQVIDQSSESMRAAPSGKTTSVCHGKQSVPL